MRTVPLFFVLAASALLCGIAASSASAGTLSGTATDSRGAAPEAVVYLSSPSAHAAPLQNAVIDQRDRMFLPHISVVTRGTTVRFPNDDTVFHNVFAYYKAKKFDLGIYARGRTKTVTFDKTGLVILLCSVHTYMSAFIVVVDTPYYAVTDKQGRFRLADVPPGTYTLHGWHESGAELTETVTVGAQPQTLDVALARK